MVNPLLTDNNLKKFIETLKLADACLEIPQFGTKHSINVSVAVGITLWEILRKMKII